MFKAQMCTYLSENEEGNLCSCLFLMFLSLCSINLTVEPFMLVLQTENIESDEIRDIEKNKKKNCGLLLYFNFFYLFLYLLAGCFRESTKKWGYVGEN